MLANIHMFEAWKGKNTTPMVKNHSFTVIIIDKLCKVISGQSYTMLLPLEDPDISKALGWDV